MLYAESIDMVGVGDGSNMLKAGLRNAAYGAGALS